MRFDKNPVRGIEAALNTIKKVTTHIPWDTLAPKWPAIAGKATLAIVESSTCIKVAKERPAIINAASLPFKYSVILDHTVY